MVHPSDKRTGGHTRDSRDFESAIDTQARRRIRSMRNGRRGVLFWVGMFGLVGWSVALPTIIGAAAGNFIDRRWDSSISWTLTLLVVGLFIGCLTAWRWLRTESEEPASNSETEQNDTQP